MKHFTFFCMFLCSATWLSAQNKSEDTVAVKAVIQQYEDAWNKNDMNTVCGLFTADGSWINIGGLYWQDQKEILKAHLAFAQYLKFMIPVKMNIQRMEIIAPGVAIVIIREQINMNHDLSFPDGRTVKQGDVINDEISLVLVKKSGRWQIKLGHNTAIDAKSEAINPALKK